MTSGAQEESLAQEAASAEYKLRQKPGTEQLLAEYLRDVPSDQDTIYATLYEPRFCPRCELAINQFYDLLKAQRPGCRYLLISAYPDSARAAAYNREKGYKADYYLYDTKNAFLDIFSFNTNGLAGQYLLKLCKSKGELVVSSTSMWMMPDYARQLVEWSERIPTHDFSITGSGASTVSGQAPRPQCQPIGGGYADHPLALGGQMLSDVYDVPKYDGRYFYYNDKLAYGIMLFEEDGDSLRLKAKVEADSAEKRRFIQIDEEQYRQLDKSSLFYFPQAATMPEGSRAIAVSYSLPSVFPDTIDNTGALVFMNAPALVTRDLETMEPLPLYSPTISLADLYEYMYQHFNYCLFKGDIIYSCQRVTWPMPVDRSVYEHEPTLNPFMKEFYHAGNQWMAAFSLKTGNRTTRFAELEPCAEASRTGYWFQNPIMYSHGGELLYSDGYSGTVHITDDIYTGTVQDYSVFALDTASFPPLDTARFYTHEYTKAYNRYFYRCIMNARMNKEKIYCLVMYSSDDIAHPLPANTDYTLVTIDRRTGMAKEELVPRYPGMTPLGYGLRSVGEGIAPFGFYRRADGSYVVREWKVAD